MRPIYRKALACLAVFVAVPLVGQNDMLSIGVRAPDFVLPSIDGANISLAGLRGNAKATLVDFWYMECAPCRMEFPEFEKLYQQFHAQGLNMVAVDKDDSGGTVSAYVHKAGLTFPIALASDEKKGNIFDRYGIHAYPGTYLLDAQGRVVFRVAGTDLVGLRRALEELGFK
jgi:peroxiredoxin